MSEALSAALIVWGITGGLIVWLSMIFSFDTSNAKPLAMGIAFSLAIPVLVPIAVIWFVAWGFYSWFSLGKSP